MQEKIIEELRQEIKAQTDENQELLKINEEHKKINGELRKEIDGLVTVIDLVREYVRNNSIYYNTSDGCQWVDQFKILEILERVNEE